MWDYGEFTLLSSLLALAGITIMINLKVELWCERWLERIFMQPFTAETRRHIAANSKKNS